MPMRRTHRRVRRAERRKIVVAPPASRPKVSVVLQKWEGFVLACDTETFTARLTPLVGEGGDQIAEIYYDEIDAEDQTVVGARRGLLLEHRLSRQTFRP